MNVPQNILLPLLQLSKEGETISLEQLVEQTKIPSNQLKQKLIDKLDGFIDVQGDMIHISKIKKMVLVEKAIHSGIGIQDIIETLHWREFEAFCLMVFDYNDFQTIQNFHFSHNKKRFEIDVVAIKEPLVFAIDAKKWKTGSGGALKTMVQNQSIRVKSLASALRTIKIRQKLPIKQWKQVLLIPMLVTSKTYEIQIFQKIPVLPFFKLNQFINEYHRYAESIQHFQVKSMVQKTLF